MPDFTRERQARGPVCGIDEAGRGPWAGPVVAAAVLFAHEDEIPQGINDSKQLSRAKREFLFDIIVSNGRFGVGTASVEEIDRLNILRASLLAMQRAYSGLGLEMPPALALIDGIHAPDLPCPCYCLPKGDSLSLSIAAASIIAKVSRDRIMADIAREYPQYGFERHAGYGTKAHREALERYGLTPWHRRSFAPVKRLIDAGHGLAEAV